MPQSLSRVLIHVVFSTKYREPLIYPEIRPQLHAYMAGTLNNLGCVSLQVGGVADHIHILCALGRTITQADLVEEVKKSSSKWMKAEGGVKKFYWQNGYGAFSVDESRAEVVKRYIRNQETHHRRKDYQDEFRVILAHYCVAYDEKYVWD